MPRLAWPFAIHCGIGVVPQRCLTGFVMSLNGSAITLSNELGKLGVRDAATLKSLIERERGSRTFSFGAELDISTQNYNLRTWLRSGGIDPDRDVRIVGGAVSRHPPGSDRPASRWLLRRRALEFRSGSRRSRLDCGNRLRTSTPGIRTRSFWFWRSLPGNGATNTLRCFPR